MCVRAMKKDKNILPLRAKSRIVGNDKYCTWLKFQRYDYMVRSDSCRYLVSLAVGQRRTINQGKVKNLFYNMDLPQRR